MQIMITNGGPHPADKWADVGTEAILNLVQVAEDSVSAEAASARQAKRDLRPLLFNILNDLHGHVQDHERGQIAKGGMKRCNAGLHDADNHAKGVMSQISDALAATPFADHFAKPEVIAVVRQIVAQHVANNMHTERCWHKDRAAANAGA